jgi:ApaG protein
MNDLPINQSDVLTHGIRVQTESYYIAERSAPMRGLYFFGYRITLSNEGDSPAKLLRRHWVIRDILGNSEEVRGDGVIGEQPRLLPTQSFTYSSFCPLQSYQGSMTGTYTMQRDDESEFDVDIASFQLFMPEVLN